MVIRQDAHPEAEADARRQLAERAEQDLRARRAREPGEEVVLDEPDVVEPGLLGRHALLDRLLVERVPVDGGARVGPLGLVEQTELHRVLLTPAWAQARRRSGCTRCRSGAVVPIPPGHLTSVALDPAAEVRVPQLNPMPAARSRVAPRVGRQMRRASDTMTTGSTRRRASLAAGRDRPSLGREYPRPRAPRSALPGRPFACGCTRRPGATPATLTPLTMSGARPSLVLVRETGGRRR